MVSVLIPVKNGIEYLTECVASVKHQTYTRWEIIIGINGYPEFSDVEAQARLCCPVTSGTNIHVKWYPTIGVAATRRAMCRDAIYPIIAILDVDDTWLPDKLEKQMAVIDAGWDVVGTRCIYNVEKGHPCYHSMHNVVSSIAAGHLGHDKFKTQNHLINSSVVLRKHLCCWRDVPLEDFDLWLFLDKINCRIVNLPDASVVHRLRLASAFNNSNQIHHHALLQTTARQFARCSNDKVVNSNIADVLVVTCLYNSSNEGIDKLLHRFCFMCIFCLPENYNQCVQLRADYPPQMTRIIVKKVEMSNQNPCTDVPHDNETMLLLPTALDVFEKSFEWICWADSQIDQ